MVGMAQSNLALQKLIHTAQTELAKIEAQLSENATATEASRLVELAVDLQEKIAELREALSG
jgi:hypothetical protein